LATREGAALEGGSASPSVRWPTALAALAHRDYQLLFTGTFFTQSGQWMQYVAVGWLILDMTGSGFYLGLAGFLRSVPQLFFSIPGGLLADRVDRRKLMSTFQGIAAALTFVLALLIASGQVQVWQVLLLTFLIGCAMAMVFPVRQTLVPNAVPREALANAVALNSANNNVTRTAGPALAGALIALVGVPICFFIQAFGLLLAFWTSVAMRVPARADVRQNSALGDLAEGWRYIRSTPPVWGLLLSAMVPTVLGMPYMALLPLFARDLEIGASGLGLLMTIMGLGSISGSIFVGYLGDFRGKGPAMLASAGLFGISLLALAVSGHLYAALASLFAAGFTSAFYQATNNTLLQTSVPDQLRGRVISAYILTWGMMPLGTLPLGWLADSTGAPFAVALAGSLVVLFSLAVTWRLPQMRAL
jgi:MFS family permease